jgi:hypothetical protein
VENYTFHFIAATDSWKRVKGKGEGENNFPHELIPIGSELVTTPKHTAEDIQVFVNRTD